MTVIMIIRIQNAGGARLVDDGLRLTKRAVVLSGLIWWQHTYILWRQEYLLPVYRLVFCVLLEVLVGAGPLGLLGHLDVVFYFGHDDDVNAEVDRVLTTKSHIILEWSNRGTSLRRNRL